MSTVLEEADQSLQIKGNYLRYWTGKKAEGYCAIGLLACKSDSVSDDGSVQGERTFLHEKYGITKKRLNTVRNCPACVDGVPQANSFYGKTSPKKTHLSAIIIHMNDDHQLTYKQIAKHLRKMKL